MTCKCSVFIATSLDGCIARSDGSIDWLEQANLRIPEGEDCGYTEFISTVDALVMGRRTLEKLMTFPEWPYGQLPVFVLSYSWQVLPAGLPSTVVLLKGSPEDVVNELVSSGHSHLYVDGGKLIQSFLAAGLITDLILTVIPILIGNGIRLFGDLSQDTLWHLGASKSFPFGFVQNHYRVIR